MSDSSSLNSVLSQCRTSLHTGILSLRQLVPVHQSLLQCSSSDTTTVDCQSMQDAIPASLQPIIQLRCNSEDQATCEGILLKPNSKDTERLLVIQYLMVPLTLIDSMRCVLISYLLLESNKREEDATILSEDLAIALLDLLDGAVVQETNEWSSILERLVQSSTPMGARILVRLLETSPLSPSLIEAFHNKLWRTVQEAVASLTTKNYRNHPLISSLSKDLLPILTEETTTSDKAILWTDLHRPHTLILWSRLFSLLDEPDNIDHQQRRQVLLVITTVLCPLLPHLVDYELPLINNINNVQEESTTRRPLEQPALCEVIFTCLEQGKSLLEEGAALSSILRKRALYLLDTLTGSSDNATSTTWKQYVMCVETLEMESEQHLVDQIWDAVAELMEDGVVEKDDSQREGFGVLTWDWIRLLFSRVLSSEQTVIRKLGMYRLLKGKEENNETSKQTRKGKKKTRNIQSRQNKATMMQQMTPDFVLNVLLPSWDSLGTSVGYNMHLENNRKVEKEDMHPLMKSLLQSYLEELNASDAEEFWNGLWNWNLIGKLHIKTILLVFQSLSQKLSSSSLEIPADNDALQSLVSMFQSLFQVGSVVLTYRKELLQTLATMLAHCRRPAGATEKKWTPLTVLRLLSLFSAGHFALDTEEWSLDGEKVLVGLKVWISGLELDPTTMGATVATAFVGGQLIPADHHRWDPITGATSTEQDLGWAIPLLCALAVNESKNTTAAELLWPAINKGLSNTAGAILASQKADHVTRALLLLENGCKLRQLSGLGNGDLVVDRNTQQLMPPPPNIEKMLSSSVDFILFHIRTILSVETRREAGESTRSNRAKRISTTYARLIAQIRTLQQSFPSSDAVSSAVEELLTSSFKALSEGVENDSKRVMLVALIYAAVSSGADPGAESHILLCRLLLKIELSGDLKEASKAWEQSARSILQYAKWAAISCILPLLLNTIQEASEFKCQEAHKFVEELLTDAFDAVEATPANALLPLFNCILAAGKQWVLTSKSSTERGEHVYVDNLEKIINALLAVMKDCNISMESTYMLDEICALIFQTKLLSEEFNRLESDPDCATPIRDAFRKLIGMAGVQRPHVMKSVLCRITVGWLGEDESDTSCLGLNAIPYRDDIVKLLLYKELKMDESAANQSQGRVLSGVAKIPSETNELSVTRAFVLVFLSKLPDPDNGLDDKVLKDLLHHVIFRLLAEVAPTSLTHPSLVMKGTPYYCLKMRGWQALCNLCRFVTSDIADRVCPQVFNSMSEPLHNQIRYFVEIFTVQCGTMHSDSFGYVFLEQISRRDLTLQHISSLMILGGNWIVGQYKLDFFNPASGDEVRLRKVLAAVIPWLSSTQGFSRAIAQQLVHALIPLAIDVDKIEDESLADSDWFLRLIYRFLTENREMKRLRNKQNKFFEKYSVKEVCTVYGVLSVPVDEGEEADPIHMVDAIKTTLKEVYAESQGSDAPVWKQVEEMLQSQQETDGNDSATEDSNGLVNFQRKIIPLDSLNLAMEDLREKRLRNVAGERKQQLIVCASLVDKVPNLGGLARTAEIFAADRLVIPDMEVCRMDNFKSLSVGAGDWIEMEEVREENLLSWLLAHKKKGYFVFGLEQTSSSISLSEMVFPDRPTVLLLGKEKEGIPVQFLQAVDQCVEIPQLGIIRSLNVHVSGAIAIWEHTKQRRLTKSS